MPTQAKKIIIYEYDTPVDRTELLPYEAGVYAWRMKNTTAGYTDAYGKTGYYAYQQLARQLVRSVKYGELDLIETASYSAMLGIDNAFYYDLSTTFLYLHLAGWEKPLDNLIIGVATGFSMNADNPYYNDTFYEPRLTKAPSVKKSIDPLFFGVLKYQATEITADNADGFFDNWRSLNLYGQKARVLLGYEGQDYSEFQQMTDGFISDDSRSFDSFSVKVQDPRKGLTQPVATNTYTTAQYPLLSSDDVGKIKPVVWGSVYRAPCVCINAGEPSPSSYTFQWADEAYPSSTYGILAFSVWNASKGIAVTPTSTDGNKRQFTLSLSDGQDADGNLADIQFSINATAGYGDSAIRYFMQYFDGKPPVDTFYDSASLALLSAPSVALYIDDDSSLASIIERICYTSDLRFFPHDDGRYCIREYDSTRAVSKTIRAYDWTDAPKIKNTGSEYLSSCVIKYRHNISDDTYLEYDSSELVNPITGQTYREDAYNRYKRFTSKTFETDAPSINEAQNKARVIMAYSSNVQDVITRSVCWSSQNAARDVDFSTLEITDFVYCDPYVRVGGTESPKVYEIIGTDKNLDKMTITLTLRYVRDSI